MKINQETMKDSLINLGFSICATIMKEGILLSKNGTRQHWSKLYKERSLLVIWYIPLVGQGITLGHSEHGYNHNIINHCE